MFTTRVRVRFGDCDPAGLVYYPQLFHYYHIALEEFFGARCGISYARLMKDERLGFPTVKTEAEFSAPFIYGDEVQIELHMERVGNSSLTILYRARRVGDFDLRAQARAVHVCMNLDARRAAPIPPNYRQVMRDEIVRLELDG